MIYSIIVAVDKNNVIGVGGRLPFHLPSDLRRFRCITMGHHVLMGRKTYESIGKPLPGRKMLVLSRDSTYKAPSCQVFTEITSAISWAAGCGETELFLIGGAEVYYQSISLTDRIYLTRVHASIVGDAYFPKIVASEWKLVGFPLHVSYPQDEYEYSFSVLHRFIKSQDRKS